MTLSGGRIPEVGRGLPAIAFAGDFLVKAGWTLGPRRIEEYELVLFPNGSQTQYKNESQTYLLTEPCFIMTRPFEVHQYIFDPLEPTRHLFAHFNYSPFRKSPLAANLLDKNGPAFIALDTDPNIQFLPKLFYHILHLAHHKSFQWEERCNSLLHTILGELGGLSELGKTVEPDKSLPPQISNALDYIDRNLHRPINIAQIAESAGWTHAHFTRIFSRIFGQTPQKVIMQLRIDRACQLMLQERWNIKQVAFAVGFEDEHYFSRIFSKLKGITATKYRERYSDPRFNQLVEEPSSYRLNRYIKFQQISDIIK